MSNIISFEEKKMERMERMIAKQEQFTSIYYNEKIDVQLSNHGNLNIFDLSSNKIVVSLKAIDVFQFIENASECLKNSGFDLFEPSEFSNNPSWK